MVCILFSRWTFISSQLWLIFSEWYGQRKQSFPWLSISCFWKKLLLQVVIHAWPVCVLWWKRFHNIVTVFTIFLIQLQYASTLCHIMLNSCNSPSHLPSPRVLTMMQESNEEINNLNKTADVHHNNFGPDTEIP